MRPQRTRQKKRILTRTPTDSLVVPWQPEPHRPPPMHHTGNADIGGEARTSELQSGLQTRQAPRASGSASAQPTSLAPQLSTVDHAVHGGILGIPPLLPISVPQAFSPSTFLTKTSTRSQSRALSPPGQQAVHTASWQGSGEVFCVSLTGTKTET